MIMEQSTVDEDNSWDIHTVHVPIWQKTEAIVKDF